MAVISASCSVVRRLVFGRIMAATRRIPRIPRRLSKELLELGRQRRLRGERKRFPLPLVSEARLQRMEKQPLGAGELRELPIARKISVGLIANDRNAPLGALHS